MEQNEFKKYISNDFKLLKAIQMIRPVVNIDFYYGEPQFYHGFTTIYFLPM